MSAQVAPTPVANVPGGVVAGMPVQAGANQPMLQPTGIVPGAEPAGQASLYVGDLKEDVTEAALFEHFNEVGPVVSIRVCRDSITRRSLGYAYVNFQFPTDARRALEELNFSDVSGHPCRIMWSQRDPAKRRSGQGNTFIKNLDPSIDNKQLFDTFLAFGSILSCKVATDEAGNSRGYGFVHFESEESAQKAIEKVNGKQLKDRIVTVSKFLSRKEREAKLGQSKFTNVYAKNLPVSIDSEEKLKEYFAGCGEITSAFLAVDAEGKPRRFGFVNFKEPEDAAKAIEEMNDREIEGEELRLFVGRAMKKSDRMRTLRREYELKQRDRDAQMRGNNLYVKHLEEHVNEDELRAAFEQYGKITSLKIAMDNNGVSRGFGFVCFETAEEATQALSEMHNKPLNATSDKPLYVALALRKDERAQQVANERSLRARAPMNPMVMHQMQQMMMMQANFGNYAGFGGFAGFPRVMPGAGQMPGVPGKMMPGMMPPGARQPMMAGPGMMPAGFAQQQAGGRGGRQGGQGQRKNAGAGRGGRQGGPRQPQGGPQAAPQPAQAAAAAQSQGSGLNASALAQLPVEQQKQQLGEHLYPKIMALYPDKAAKITGMLLEMDNAELLHLLDEPAALEERANDAHKVLVEYEQKAAEAGASA